MNKKTRESMIIKILNKPLIEKLGRHDIIYREVRTNIKLLERSSGFVVKFFGYFVGVKEVYLLFEDFKQILKPESLKKENSALNRRLITETTLGLLEIN